MFSGVAEAFDGFEVGVAFEDVVSGDEYVGAGFADFGGGGLVDSAVDFEVSVAEHGAHEPDFFEHLGDEGLAAEAWVDGHDEDHVDGVDEELDVVLGGAGVEDDAGLAAEAADFVDQAQGVERGFDVEGDGRPWGRR